MNEFHSFVYQNRDTGFVEVTRAGEGVTCRQLVADFGRYLLACGYHPDSVDAALAEDWNNGDV